MPIISMNLLEGFSVEKKRLMVAAVTDVVSETLEVDPQTIRIIINDLKYENLSVAGKLKSDTK